MNLYYRVESKLEQLEKDLIPFRNLDKEEYIEKTGEIKWEVEELFFNLLNQKEKHLHDASIKRELISRIKLFDKENSLNVDFNKLFDKWYSDNCAHQFLLKEFNSDFYIRIYHKKNAKHLIILQEDIEKYLAIKNTNLPIKKEYKDIVEAYNTLYDITLQPNLLPFELKNVTEKRRKRR